MSGQEIENRLSGIRRRRGFSAARLASVVGVRRQTIYAIEAGTYSPNTAVALRLARALEVTVEDLFALPEDATEVDSNVTIVAGGDLPQSGQPVQLCRVDDKLMAAAASPFPWYLPVSDAVMTGKTRVRVHAVESEFANRILVAGCDPGISVLARHAQAAGVELVLAHRNSSQALQLLKAGSVHIAGTHLRDEASGESNVGEVGRIFPRDAVALISFAVWEEGLLTARGNPKGIRGVDDLGRGDVRIVNREKGSGSRRLLDSHLMRAGISAASVGGYERMASGHLAAAWLVRTGDADCCVATRAAAQVLGLDFIPLVSERYDLAIRRSHLSLPAVEILCDTLSRASFRRELESIGGYDTRIAGQRVL
jgi:molybdate-binding protein/DNA-binding XRE family transcriptional regulator